MWQPSVNFIGARLAGDDDAGAGAGWRHLATHPTPVGVGVATEAEAEAEAFLPCLDVDSCDTHLQALPDIGDGVSMAGSRVVSSSSPLFLPLQSLAGFAWLFVLSAPFLTRWQRRRRL